MSKQAAVRVSSNTDPFQSTYEALRKLLTRHAPPFALSGMENEKPQLHLRTPKQIVVPGAYGGKAQHIALACVILQKGYVGFYYFPLYLDPRLQEQLSPRLRKLLKGKTCFHIKGIDEELERDIESALNIGKTYFRDQGWI